MTTPPTKWSRHVSMWITRSLKGRLSTTLRVVLTVLILFAGILASILPFPRAVTAAPGQAGYTGWAITLYPDMSDADLRATFSRMQRGGANLVWLAHSNPGEVDPSGAEVGLSYAVYAAAMNPSDPQHTSAQSIVAVQRRALEAARAVGIKVILSIGYRTQMGAAWNAAHSESLRRGPDGAVLNFGGVDASPYAGDFRSDMAHYYRWVHQTLVTPYRDVILMLNLADEPSGVDYSWPAEATFRSRVGYGFADVGTDAGRVRELGAFQSRVMVDFAIWASQQWLEIDPGVVVTFSFDGSPARHNQQGPPIEDIFRRAPPNLQPTWDAYLRDGTAQDKLNDADLTALSTLIGTLAHFSARHERPYWLWSSGNSWGLGQQSDDPSTIADAVVNLRLLANISRQGGGLLRGIAVWSYNVRGQGLYNNPHPTTYAADDLFAKVTAALPGVRQVLEGPTGAGAEALVLAPNTMPFRLIGASRLVDIWSFRGYNFGDLVSLARSGANVAVVDTLAGENLARVRLLVVLAREPEDLTPTDVDAIRAFRASGRAVVVGEKVESAFHLGAQWVYPGNAPEGFFADAYTAHQPGPVASLGMPRLANSFAIVGPSEIIAYGGTSHDAPDTMRAWVRLPYRAKITTYSAAGSPESTAEVGPGLVAIPTRRHAFASIPLIPLAPLPPNEQRYFPQTGFRVDDDVIWDYFQRRGGIRTFGYPVSRTFTFLGLRTQIFQRAVVQLGPSTGGTASPRLLNLLDPELLPYTQFNGATFPALDEALVATAPTPSNDDYAIRIVSWTRANAPDSWQGLPVNFGTTFTRTVTLADAFPRGGGTLAFLPLLNLEIWGVPTSRPLRDPNNHDFVYQRFQRGILMYDASCHCTQGVLLADYLKSIITGLNLPPDLEAAARTSPYYRQYDSTRPHWVRDPSRLPNTDLTEAFTPE